MKIYRLCVATIFSALGAIFFVTNVFILVGTPMLTEGFAHAKEADTAGRLASFDPESFARGMYIGIPFNIAIGALTASFGIGLFARKRWARWAGWGFVATGAIDLVVRVVFQHGLDTSDIESIISIALPLPVLLQSAGPQSLDGRGAQ